MTILLKKTKLLVDPISTHPLRFDFKKERNMIIIHNAQSTLRPYPSKPIHLIPISVSLGLQAAASGSAAATAASRSRPPPAPARACGGGGVCGRSEGRQRREADPRQRPAVKGKSGCGEKRRGGSGGGSPAAGASRAVGGSGGGYLHPYVLGFELGLHQRRVVRPRARPRRSSARSLS